MRIDNNSKFIGTNTDKTQELKKAEAKALKNSDKSAGVESTGDKVTLSSTSMELVNLTQQLKDMPDVREDLVNELKSKISEGTYDVSGKDIAAKIVDRALSDIY